MKNADEALCAVADDATRLRVLRWLNDKHGLALSVPENTTVSPRTPAPTRTDEMSGIARVTESGQLQITIRDLKASSKSDATLRLVHVAVLAHEQLLGTGASRTAFLTPTLKRYRLYDGNARRAISQHKGLLRDGDVISLDAHATKDAERYVAEICDASVLGSWKPDGKKQASTTRSKQK